MIRRAIAIATLLAAISSLAFGQQKTEISDKKAATMLLGTHNLSLQWISWDRFGKATVSNKKGVYAIVGSQKARGNTDFLLIDGIISEIAAREFTFVGKITTQISHIAGGRPCVRDGEFTFKITGKRKYWRLQQMDNPCDEAADYVDLYFR